MPTFIAVCTFTPEATMEAITTLAPAERTAAADLQAAGRLGTIHIALPRRTVFIEVNAADKAAAEATVHELPMAPLWAIDTYEVTAPPASGA
jgi:hypothetical protein